jgi:hypothetical protein
MKNRASLLVGFLWLATLVSSYSQPLPVRLVFPHLGNGNFEFTALNGSTANYTIYASTDLVNWIPLTNLVSDTAQFQVRDVQAANFQHRFYRVKAEALPPPVIAPTITAQPQSQTVTEGVTVTFSVVADGTKPMNYQWMFNGVTISGPNGPQLTINNAQSANAGNYTVLVSNGAGFAMSQPATLTVNKADLAPDSIAGKTITSSITSGSPPFASSGTARMVVASSGNTYLIVPVSGNIRPASGTYSYTKTGANTATVILSDPLLGSQVGELTFINSTGGTFITRGFGTFQTGNFSIN